MSISVIIGICIYVAVGLFAFFVLVKILVQALLSIEVSLTYKQLSNYFNSGVEVSDSDIEDIIFKRLSQGSYLAALEGYRLYLLDGHSDKVNDINRVNSILNDLIKQKKEIAPYEGIGEREKQAMLSIESLAPDADSKAAVKENLLNLSDSIRRYKKELSTKEKIKNWVAVAGLIISVITFFVGTRLSNKSFDAINSQLSGMAKDLDTVKMKQGEEVLLLMPEDEE